MPKLWQDQLIKGNTNPNCHHTNDDEDFVCVDKFPHGCQNIAYDGGSSRDASGKVDFSPDRDPVSSHVDGSNGNNGSACVVLLAAHALKLIGPVVVCPLVVVQ